MKAQKAKRGVMSPSLLENVLEKQSKDAHKRICLGMGQLTESSSGEEEGNALPTWSRQPAKKLKLSSDKQVPVNFLEGTDDPAALWKWLTLYVTVLNAKAKREQVPSQDTLQPADWPTLT